MGFLIPSTQETCFKILNSSLTILAKIRGSYIKDYAKLFVKM